MGTAYIVVAAMDMLGMADMNDKPSNYKFPINLEHKSLDEKKAYFDNILEVFVNRFIVQRGGGICNDDFVMNYALCSMFLTTLLLQMKDTAKEADGNRNLINQKLLLTIFKSLGTYSTKMFGFFSVFPFHMI